MRKVNQHILIIPEGWCEYNYAQALKQSLRRDKQRNISVEMPTPNNENTALQLLDKAEKKIKKAKENKNPYDAVWLFFDNDNQSDLKTFFEKLPKNQIKIAYSSLCIEHWFILHLEDNRQAYSTTNDVKQRINALWQRYFKLDYHKTKVNHFEKLEDRLSFAIERAKLIKQHAEENNIPMHQRNPFFTIHELIQQFQSL